MRVRYLFNIKDLESRKRAICDTVSVERLVICIIPVATEPELGVPDRRSRNVLPIKRPIPIAVLLSISVTCLQTIYIREIASIATFLLECSLIDMEKVPVPGKKGGGIMS